MAEIKPFCQVVTPNALTICGSQKRGAVIRRDGAEIHDRQGQHARLDQRLHDADVLRRFPRLLLGIEPRL